MLLNVPVLPKEWAIEVSEDGRTVTVTGDGIGGRNQEVALAAAMRIGRSTT